jgi:membrane-bound inhibitor of C-type lysozyme
MVKTKITLQEGETCRMLGAVQDRKKSNMRTNTHSYECEERNITLTNHAIAITAVLAV